MKKIIIQNIILIFFLFHYSASVVVSQEEDTIPPTFVWTHPQDMAIITTNSIRLSVDAHDNEGGSGIQKVVFIAQYHDSHGFTPRKIIGEITSEPYEFMWECSGIPDQNIEKLKFYCQVVDNAGNVITIPEDSKGPTGPEIVLDRTKDTKEDVLLSNYDKNEILIDGSLSEWAPKDSITFLNNDNKITVFSSWNNDYAYFGFRIEDKSVISLTEEVITEETSEIAKNDDIEIWIDTNHDHFEIFTVPDKSYIMSPTGIIYEYKKNVENYKTADVNLSPNVEYKVTVHGTLNNSSDADTCYIMELSIPWSELGEERGINKSIGFEFWNNDKDFIEGTHFYAGWTTSNSTLKNPSEWGNVEFFGRKRRFGKALIVLLLSVSGMVAVFIVRIIRNKDKSEEDENQELFEKESIKNARQYIEEHYSDDNLSREEVPVFVNLTPSYFGKLFKKEVGSTFGTYISSVRIEKAKKLLSTGNRNISEIAFEVGFKSLSHFGYVFKSSMQQSPKEYRQTFQKNR